MSLAGSELSSEPRSRKGRVASAGLAAGPIVRLEARRASPLPEPGAGSAEAERGRLAAALAQAREQLAGLARASSGEAADILAFQIALLEDEALSAPAFAAVAEGRGAEAAWQTAIGVLVADYDAAGEEYFRARAADLRDLEGRVLDALAGGCEAPRLPEAAILLAEDLAPSLFLALDWSGRGIALEAGSATSHVAMLARARGVPMVVGLGELAARTGEPALLDATEGTLVIAPGGEAVQRLRARRAALEAERRGDEQEARRPAFTGDGEPVEVHVNIAAPADLAGLDAAICDGIGLVRTELMLDGQGSLLDEDRQAEAYSGMLRWAGGRPVTIRTLDAGGDKPIPGLTIDGEANPFLGVRGLRLSFARPEVFRTQLRALLRAAPAGRLRIMIPMVSLPMEMERVRGFLAEARAELEQAGKPHGRAELGMMVEVPSAAIALDLFTTDFVSIGSNDLTQYTMAASRDSDALAEIADAGHPAVLRLIAMVVEKSRALGIPVSLCGDAAADPRLLPLLLAAGLRSVSVAPARVGEVKRLIAAFRRQPERTGRASLVRRLGRALGVARSARG